MGYLGKELEAALHDIKLVSRRLLELERNQRVPKPGRPTIAEWMGQQDGILEVAFSKELSRMSSGNPILDRLSFRDIQGLSLIIPTMRGQITHPLEALSVEFDLPKGELGEAAEIVENFALPALIDKFMHLLFYGNPEHGVKGLHQLISPDLTIHAGHGTGTSLSHTKLNELLCNIREPELIVSTPRVCASMMTYLQSIGLMGGGIEEYPAGIASYKTVPW